MIIRVQDIPQEGRELEFVIKAAPLNARIGAVQQIAEPGTTLPPDYVFSSDPHVELRLELQGTSVLANGFARGVYRSQCSRCNEEIEREMQAPVDLVLKHGHPGNGADIEDVKMGYYQGEEIDFTEWVEERMVIELPYRVLCREDCHGLCLSCGTNLNSEQCSCKSTDVGDERFAALRGLLIEEGKNGNNIK